MLDLSCAAACMLIFTAVYMHHLEEVGSCCRCVSTGRVPWRRQGKAATAFVWPVLKLLYQLHSGLMQHDSAAVDAVAGRGVAGYQCVHDR